MLETWFVMAKALPIVFLAGLALSPVTAFDDAIVRTAEAVASVGLLWRLVVQPVVRRVRAGWAKVEGGFSDLREVKADVKDVKRDLASHVGDKSAHPRIEGT